jgi:ABC-type transport system substrate-binding protein
MVREALVYAVDRQSMVDSIVKLGNPDAEVLNCGFLAIPTLGPWCKTKPFEQFSYDPDKARSVLEDDGYDCSATPCKKNGKPLIIDYATNGNLLRRSATFELFEGQAIKAGIDLRIGLVEAGTLIDQIGIFPITEAEQVVRADPSVSSIFGCPVGENLNSWCDPEAASLISQSDQELDPARRLELMNEIYAIEARDFIGIPLYAVPANTGWRTDQIAGPIGVWNSSPYGTFFNMNEWYVP